MAYAFRAGAAARSDNTRARISVMPGARGAESVVKTSGPRANTVWQRAPAAGVG
jgi:hypothetical protein